MSTSAKTPSRLPRRTAPPFTNPGSDLTAAKGLPPLTPRITSRAMNRTPHYRESPQKDLRQLAGMMQERSTTPPRSTNVELASSNKDTDAPAVQVRTPSLRRAFRVVPRKQGPPTTPHAIRALERRRAAVITPARDRRRSGRLQRETPRNVLRNLSRILAATSQQTVLPPQSLHPVRDDINGMSHDELEMDPDPPMPRLSLAIDEYGDEDSVKSPPPHSSEPLNDDMQTQYSVEIPRKAYNEQPIGGLLRGSFGSVRISDRFNDLNDTTREAMSDDIHDELQSPAWEDEDDGQQFGLENNLGGDSEDLRHTLLDARIRRRSSPQSSVRREQMFQPNDDSTFAFDIPVEQDESTLRSDSRQNYVHSPDRPRLLDNPQTGENNISVRPDVMRARKTKAQKKTSRYGMSYPSLAPNIVKKLAVPIARSSGIGSAKVNKIVINSIIQASDWFFEQIGDDLSTYAKHAGRKTIDESDIMALMKRQRQLNATTTAFSLAQKYLPRELLQEIRMGPSTVSRLRRQCAEDAPS